MQLIVTYAPGVYCCLSEINSGTYIFNFAYCRPDALYLREHGCEDPWLFFEAKKCPRAKKFGKRCSADMCGVPGIVVLVQTRCGLDGPGFDQLVGARDFVFSTPVHTDHRSHPLSSTLGTGTLSLG